MAIVNDSAKNNGFADATAVVIVPPYQEKIIIWFLFAVVFDMAIALNIAMTKASSHWLIG